MSSPPENMKLEGLIADNWDDDALTPGFLQLLEPYRADIEQIAESFDPETQSWRGYRPSVWSPVPIDMRRKITRIWAECKLAGRAEPKNQPAPTPNDGESIWEIVINDVQATYGETGARESLLADMRDRDRMGRAKYGTPLQAHNGRDAVRDAYEEALDGTVYSRQAYEESTTRPEGSDQALHVIYQDFVELAYRLRVTMNMRNK